MGPLVLPATPQPLTLWAEPPVQPLALAGHERGWLVLLHLPGPLWPRFPAVGELFLPFQWLRKIPPNSD